MSIFAWSKSKGPTDQVVPVGIAPDPTRMKLFATLQKGRPRVFVGGGVGRRTVRGEEEGKGVSRRDTGLVGQVEEEQYLPV